VSEQQRTRLEELSRSDSLELLQSWSHVGRLGFIVDGLPMILPVNCVANDESIVFCTSPGTKLSAVGGGAQVVFEVDESRPTYPHRGWSVIVRGIAREVTDPEELEILRRGPLLSWAVRPSEHWVRISIDEITGRRIPED
jgi:uncharacterized protein